MTRRPIKPISAPDFRGVVEKVSSRNVSPYLFVKIGHMLTSCVFQDYMSVSFSTIHGTVLMTSRCEL
jgi:hypothetical protein